MAHQLINTPVQLHTDTDRLDQLIAGVAAQDSEALAGLYRETSAAIYAFALSMLKNTHDAEDALHDSYLLIHSAAGSYHSTPTTALRTICCLRRFFIRITRIMVCYRLDDLMRRW